MSLADKLDSLAGLFAVGAIPSGSADPFGLRRAALGIVNNLMETETDFVVADGLAKAAALMAVDVTGESLDETNTFVTRRLQGVLAEMGYNHDVVNAVLGERAANPAGAKRAADALTSMVQESWWEDAFTAFARCARITRNLEEIHDLNPAAYEEAVEQELHDAYLAAANAMSGADEPATVLGAQIQALQGPINAYFDAVMVNAEDETVRNARLALVQRIAGLADGIAEMSDLQGF